MDALTYADGRLHTDASGAPVCASSLGSNEAFLQSNEQETWMVVGIQAFFKYYTVYDFENDQIGYAVKTTHAGANNSGALPEAATKTCKGSWATAGS